MQVRFTIFAKVICEFICLFNKYSVSVSGRPPIFISQPQTTYVFPHSSLQLNCTADGWPFPTISWYRGGAPLTQFNGSLVNGSLMIPSVTDGLDSSTAGVQYQCAATNIFGTILGTMTKVYTICECRAFLGRNNCIWMIWMLVSLTSIFPPIPLQHLVFTKAQQRSPTFWKILQ